MCILKTQINNCELQNHQSTTIWRFLQSVKSRSLCWNYSPVIQHFSLCYYHYYCTLYIHRHFGAMPCAPSSCFKLWPHLLSPLQWLLLFLLPFFQEQWKRLTPTPASFTCWCSPSFVPARTVLTSPGASCWSQTKREARPVNRCPGHIYTPYLFSHVNIQEAIAKPHGSYW